MDGKRKIIIATHQMLYGASHALRDFLVQNKIEELFFAAHPINILTQESIFEIFKKGKSVRKEKIKRHSNFFFFNYFLDFFYTLKWVFSQEKKYEIFIGVDNLNCLAGLLLKRLKRVEKVIYYSIDFSPIRFENKILNFIYHEIERICVRYSNQVWNVSPKIAEGREKFLGLSSQKYQQKVVPIGVWYKKVKKLPFSKIKKHQVLFLGHLLEKQGLQKVVEAIPLITQEIKNFNFLIIGGGEYKTVLREKIKRLGIEDYVRFRGWIKEREILDKILSESACAVATYKPGKERLDNFTYYADSTKVKDYLSAGLPVILTDVPYNAKILEKNRCGIVVKYEKKDIAQTILTLLKDENRLREYRENALKMAQEFDWNNIFERAFKNEN